MGFGGRRKAQRTGEDRAEQKQYTQTKPTGEQKLRSPQEPSGESQPLIGSDADETERTTKLGPNRYMKTR